MIFFTKMNAVGNDFIIIDCMNGYPKYSLNILSKYLCDRHLGIGADGVIYFTPSKKCDIKMRIFNSDGTEAEMCGNGIRCLAKYLYEKNIIKKDKFEIETLGGKKEIKLSLDNKIVRKVEVNMGKVLFDSKSLPAYLPKENQNIEIDYNNRIFEFYPANVGNPHVVCFVNNFNDFNFENVGEYVENYKYFPKKTNVEFVKVDNNSTIKVKVWERGVRKNFRLWNWSSSGSCCFNRKVIHRKCSNCGIRWWKN